MCITKEVEPRAATFSSVELCSTKNAMRVKLRSGQIPGDGGRICHAANPNTIAAMLVRDTKTVVLLNDRMDWNSLAGDRGVRD